MVTRLAHALAARPAVYNAIQRAAGVETVLRQVRAVTAAIPAPGRAVDIGGGTGMLRNVWPAATRYVNVEPDPAKLTGFRRADSAGWAIQGDGTRLPVQPAACDAVTIQFVLHHLDNDALGAMLSECARILKPGGRLIVVEPLWEPRRLAGRLLWRYDRGRHPRDAETIRAALAAVGPIDMWRTFAIYHAYVIAVARRAP